MKVLHLLSTNSYAGAENVACQIIEMINDDNIECVYCSLDGRIREALKNKNIKFLPIKKVEEKELEKVVLSEKIDLIHSHDFRATYVAHKVCKKHKNIRLISHIHGNDEKARRISVKSLSLLVASKTIDKIIWVSKSCFEDFAFRNSVKNKSIVLNNVIDGKKVLEKSNQDENTYQSDIIFLGNLVYPKNPERLIKVLSMVVKRKSDVRISVVGNICEESLKRTFNESFPDNTVALYGYKENPYKILKTSKLLILTSRYEGLPLCSLEALCLGVPVVGTVADGLTEIIKNGYNGYLVESDEEFVEKITSILSDKDLRKALSENAKESFDTVNNTDNYRNVIKNLYLNSKS